MKSKLRRKFKEIRKGQKLEFKSVLKGINLEKEDKRKGEREDKMIDLDCSEVER